MEGPLNVVGTWNVDLAIGMAEGALLSTCRGVAGILRCF